MEFICEDETIRAAIIVSLIAILIIATLVVLMYIKIRGLTKEKNVDNCLHFELENKEKTILNLKQRNSILMKENINIASQRNDLASLLQKSKGL